MDSDQQKETENSSENTETKSFTVGAAPPADGNAMKWAASVLHNPIPVSYKVSPIENLFTANFMKHVDINNKSVLKNVVKYRQLFETFLKIKGFYFLTAKRLASLTQFNTRLLNPKFNRRRNTNTTILLYDTEINGRSGCTKL